MLNVESIWNIETDSEPELDIRFNEDLPEDDSASDISTLQNLKKKAAKQKKASKQTHNRQLQTKCIPGPPTQLDQPGPSSTTRWTQPTKNPRPQRKPQQPKRKQTLPTKRTMKPNKEFEQRSKEAALAQSKLEKAKQTKGQTKLTTHPTGYNKSVQQQIGGSH